MQKWNTLDTIWTCTPRAVFGLIRDAQVERDIPGGMAHICNVDLSRRGISLQKFAAACRLATPTQTAEVRVAKRRMVEFDLGE